MMNTVWNEMNRPSKESVYDRRYLTARRSCYELRRQLFYLWTFIAEQGMWEDAIDFIDEHDGMSIPFDLFLDESLL